MSQSYRPFFLFFLFFLLSSFGPKRENDKSASRTQREGTFFTTLNMTTCVGASTLIVLQGVGVNGTRPSPHSCDGGGPRGSRARAFGVNQSLQERWHPSGLASITEVPRSWASGGKSDRLTDLGADVCCFSPLPGGNPFTPSSSRSDRFPA